jgi:hypothetical protein
VAKMQAEVAGSARIYIYIYIYIYMLDPIVDASTADGQFVWPQGARGRTTHQIRGAELRLFSKLKAYLRMIAERTVAGLIEGARSLPWPPAATVQLDRSLL